MIGGAATVFDNNFQILRRFRTNITLYSATSLTSSIIESTFPGRTTITLAAAATSAAIFPVEILTRIPEFLAIISFNCAKSNASSEFPAAEILSISPLETPHPIRSSSSSRMLQSSESIRYSIELSDQTSTATSSLVSFSFLITTRNKELTETAQHASRMTTLQGTVFVAVR